jgi:hypothetical protein
VDRHHPSAAASGPESPPAPVVLRRSASHRSAVVPAAKAESAIRYAIPCFRYNAQPAPAKVPNLITNLRSHGTSKSELIRLCRKYLILERRAV